MVLGMTPNANALGPLTNVHIVIPLVQALSATRNIERGNVHLNKAIAYNNSARMVVVYIMLLASMMLLFFDWYSS